MKVQIKNMVCHRCVLSVESILRAMEVPFEKVDLGEAILERELSEEEHIFLKKELSAIGFEMIQQKQERLITRIKSVIIEEVYAENSSNLKLSELLSEKLHYDYSHITHLFSEAEGKSIQNFYNLVRVERAKELLEYDEYSMAEIADILDFSTPAYLSTSFKKLTGYTPSEYKSLKAKNRNTLDSI